MEYATRIRWNLGQHPFITEEILRNTLAFIRRALNANIHNQQQRTLVRGCNYVDALTRNERDIQELEHLLSEIEIAFFFRRFDFQRDWGPGYGNVPKVEP